MTYDPQKHHRRSIRLCGYDYRDPGAYFVTIGTDERRYLFGGIIDDEMHLNDIGQAVQWICTAMPERFPTIELDQYVIMPNHIHCIMILHPSERTMNCGLTCGLLVPTLLVWVTRCEKQRWQELSAFRSM